MAKPGHGHSAQGPGWVVGQLASGHWGWLAWPLVTGFAYFVFVFYFVSLFRVFRCPLATRHLATRHWGPGSVAGHLATDHWGWLARPLVIGR